MKKISTLFCLLGLTFASTASWADNQYDMGIYANANIGGGVLRTPELNLFDIIVIPPQTVGLFLGRVGIGGLLPISHSQNPFFLGFEANGDIGSMSHSDLSQTVYGGDASVIIGKVINSSIGLYGKLGAQTLGNHDLKYIVGPQVGLGLGYQVSQHFRLNVEANTAIFNNADYTVTGSLGIQYTFSS